MIYMEKKYELVPTDIKKSTILKRVTWDDIDDTADVTLYRIRAIKSFGDVKAGELGGLVESEKNLSHGCTCWIDYTSAVIDDAKVLEHGVVMQNSVVRNHSIIYGKSKISVESRVHGNSRITGNVVVNNSDITDSRINSTSKICSSTLKSCTIREDASVLDGTTAQNITLVGNSSIEKSVIVNCDFSERKSVRIVSGGLFNVNTLLYIELGSHDISIYPSFNTSPSGLVASSHTIDGVEAIPIDDLWALPLEDLDNDILSRLNDAIRNHKNRWFNIMCGGGK